MHPFTDNAKRTWEIAIHVTAIKQVRELLDVDLLEILDDGKLLEQLSGDPVLLVDVLYVLCREQAHHAGVSDEDFGRAMAGEAIDRATTAFLEELADFFRNPERRQLLKAAIAKLGTLEAMALDDVMRRLESGELEAKVRDLLAKQQT